MPSSRPTVSPSDRTEAVACRPREPGPRVPAPERSSGSSGADRARRDPPLARGTASWYGGTRTSATMQAMTGPPLQVITAPQVLLDDVLVSDGWVAIRGDRIEAVGTGIPPYPPTWPLPDGVLAPGLIDAQCNGAFGVDLAAADDESWDLVLRSLPATGVTAVVPTFISAPLPQLRDALRAAAPRIREARRAPAPGRARPLGIHVEGPFLSERRRGAHDASLLCDPDPDRLQDPPRRRRGRAAVPHARAGTARRVRRRSNTSSPPACGSPSGTPTRARSRSARLLPPVPASSPTSTTPSDPSATATPVWSVLHSPTTA
jgi:hypothetical protein